jgi:hypothetical protein
MSSRVQARFNGTSRVSVILHRLSNQSIPADKRRAGESTDRSTMVSKILSRALVSFPGMPFFRPVDSRPMFPQNFSRLVRRCLIFVSLCPPVLALNPNQPLAQFYHTSWNAKQGVTGNVTALAQTTDGYLWVGTTDGLLRFDGISLQRYQPDEGALMATNVSALMAVPDGGLWVGFNRGGASFIRNGQVTPYSNSTEQEPFG